MRDVLDLLEDHSARYNDFDLENVGGVAKQAERLSDEYDKSPKAIYEKHVFFHNMPTGYSASFSLRLGELRGIVKIALEAVRK